MTRFISNSAASSRVRAASAASPTAMGVGSGSPGSGMSTRVMSRRYRAIRHQRGRPPRNRARRREHRWPMAQEKTTPAFGQNAWLVDEMYEQFRQDPASVSASWQEFFADYRPTM